MDQANKILYVCRRQPKWMNSLLGLDWRLVRAMNSKSGSKVIGLMDRTKLARVHIDESSILPVTCFDAFKPHTPAPFTWNHDSFEGKSSKEQRCVIFSGIFGHGFPSLPTFKGIQTYKDSEQFPLWPRKSKETCMTPFAAWPEKIGRGDIFVILHKLGLFNKTDHEGSVPNIA